MTDLTERIRVSLLRTVKADPSSPKLGTLDIPPARVPRFQQEEQPEWVFRLPTFFREVRGG